MTEFILAELRSVALLRISVAELNFVRGVWGGATLAKLSRKRLRYIEAELCISPRGCKSFARKGYIFDISASKAKLFTKLCFA
jgi:hypothetical protein